MGTLTRDGSAIPAYNDPVSGAAPDIGAYEYGLTPWDAGFTNKFSATVSLGNLNQTYDGTAKAVTAATTPTNVAVSLTYDGFASAPTNAGNYTVVGSVVDNTYQGATTNTLIISQATATVTLSHLSQTYDGTAKTVSVTTAPPSLPVNVTYDGSPSAPTNAGSYTVIGTVTNPNYAGAATNTLVIASAIPATPTNLTWSVTNGTLQLSWPSNYLGWELQVQTNSLGAGLSTNWVVMPGTTNVTSTNLSVDAAIPAAFYRLHLPN